MVTAGGSPALPRTYREERISKAGRRWGGGGRNRRRRLVTFNPTGVCLRLCSLRSTLLKMERAVSRILPDQNQAACGRDLHADASLSGSHVFSGASENGRP